MKNLKLQRPFNGFNVGIGLGASYYFTDNIGLTARYVAGVTDIAKDRPANSDAIRNNVFQVGLAFKFIKRIQS
ncbi:outer membrane beta-barrel protein [Chryseobacterium indoltheticum]|uniref:outer membrane beta-barrel protein n=1 Tax=Chryseobacterium indoltheticum TaxID=254 RepID=UPI003F490F34